MESLPEDVWLHILRIGIDARQLNHVDLCSLAVVNSCFDQLTQNRALWAILLSRDFPSPSRFYNAPSKALYKRKHQISREKRLHDAVKELEDTMEYLRGLSSSRDRDRDRPSESHGIFYGRRNFSQPASASHVNRRHPFDIAIPTIGKGDDLVSWYWHVEDPLVLCHATDTSLSYYENKLSKKFDKASRQKVFPNSKSYVPMNKPPRRSMPRKI